MDDQRPFDDVRGAVRERPRLVRDVLLRDGSTLRLEAATAADFPDLVAFYEGLSRESRYFRFHGFGRVDGVARAEAEASGVDRLALLARHGGRVVAAASYEGLREPGVAEVAFAVADEFQRRGIGTRMLEQLAAIGAERAIDRFDAEVMAETRAMLGVFEHAGFAVQREGWTGEVTVSLDITPSDAVTERIDERDHFAAIASLRPVLAPASVAVVGAAPTPGNLGRRVLANIIADEFQGAVEAVNRDGDAVCSLPAARRIAELKVAPELVIVAADSEEELLEFAAEAGASGARALLVLPAAPDKGAAFASHEEQLLEIVRDAGARLVGPNSLGVINTAPDVSLNATFSRASMTAGTLAICSQSGAPGIGLLGHAAARQLGIAMHVSVGNRADVSTNDLLECWEDDDRISAVMLYVETFGNPEHFARIAQRVSRKKPILALKGGRQAAPTQSERRSQTAAAIRGETIIDALLHQAGVLRFRSVEELVDAAGFFESQPLPRGRRVGIISNSAGVATIAADTCIARGLEIADTSKTENPLLLEISAGPDRYATSIRKLLADRAIDALMVFYVDLLDNHEAVLAAITAAAAAQHKPVVASAVGSDGRLPGREEPGVPNYLFPESCAAVLARAAERRQWLSRPLGEHPRFRDLEPPAAHEVVTAFLDRQPSGGWLPLHDTHHLLAAFGIPYSPSSFCKELECALTAAADTGHPVAIKADLAPPAYAGEIDAVLLGLEGETAIRAAWRELRQRVSAAGREWNGAIVQPLAAAGADFLVGAVRDPDLGNVVAVGLGGRHAAAGGSTAFRLVPATDAEADELIDTSGAVAAELEQWHGEATLDRAALRELILRLALLLREVPELAEADLNPVRCTTSGCLVLDAQARIEPRPRVERTKTW
ncbi:MAG: bifunctional acetate--CoA ligase family protein/GNAT family N-acetyltransferase [Solirubrobacteraceae bacterium]